MGRWLDEKEDENVSMKTWYDEKKSFYFLYFGMTKVAVINLCIALPITPKR